MVFEFTVMIIKIYSDIFAKYNYSFVDKIFSGIRIGPLMTLYWARRSFSEVKSFVGIGSLWKLDWWSNDWLTSWLIGLLTYHLTTEGGRALIPILVIGELRLFDIIAWRREKLLINENLSILHSNKFLWMQRIIIHFIH
jgi:hypothetical protein